MSGPADTGRARRGIVALIAAREIRERLRTRSYLALTVFLVLVILVLGVVGRIAGGDNGPEPIDLGVTEPVPEDFGRIVADAGDAVGLDIGVQPVVDADRARTGVEDGDLDAAVVTSSGEIVFEDEADDELVAVVQQAWSLDAIRSDLVAAGVAPAEVDAILSPAPLQVVSLDESDDSDVGLAVLVGTLVSILLFISLQTFGGYVLVGVVEEKSTAVVELLLAKVRADQLLAGKVLGIGTAALLQFTAAIVAGIGALAISGTDVPSDIWSSVPVAIVWFLGGYALYSTLFALAGSLVSRQEDAQAAAAPILIVMVAAYMLVFVLGYVPDSTASTVMSLIPPLAPFLMPMRMIAGAASVAEVVVSLVLLVATIVVAWRVAGAIYRQVLLRRGSRITWRDALSVLGGA